ncbi:MAG: metal ABC transporter permease [Planctomycetes bacterium]|nr:metal ABC transporter permease [Planctomycetota bacterium]
MLEDLCTLARMFPAAIAAGFVISSVCALLGVFVILKRVVFIGITLSEAAACGIAAAMVYNFHPYVGACALTLLAVGVLAYPFETNRLPRDAVLGVIFVLTSGLSILLVAKSGFGLHEVKALLYGDLILTTDRDLTIVLATLLPVAVYLLAFLRPTVYTFLDREAARVLGLRVVLWELLYFFALGLAVSAASKVAGALLVFCYLVVAPSAALLLSRRLGLVMLLAVAAAVLSTGIGMYWSFAHDLPTNQSIAVISCAVFCLAVMVRGACLVASAAGCPSRTRVGQPESPR